MPTTGLLQQGLLQIHLDFCLSAKPAATPAHSAPRSSNQLMFNAEARRCGDAETFLECGGKRYPARRRLTQSQVTRARKRHPAH
jgi:hypothetical protein